MLHLYNHRSGQRIMTFTTLEQPSRSTSHDRFTPADSLCQPLVARALPYLYVLPVASVSANAVSYGYWITFHLSLRMPATV